MFIVGLGEVPMIILIGASSIFLAALQATITAPTAAFRGCLKEATAKATSEKVGADNIEGFLRTACTIQMGTLKDALIAFRLKNGMSRKMAADDAQMTLDDYVSTPADNYKFLINYNAPKQQQAAPAKTPPPPPASPQPPKP
jgi:hypothetical protein